MSEREVAWAEERQHLLQELEQRDALLQVADEHMEAEIEKLQDQLTRQHAKQLNEEVKVSEGWDWKGVKASMSHVYIIFNSMRPLRLVNYEMEKV